MEEESKDAPDYDYEALANKTNKSEAEEYLSHEEYVARNNSCSSMDEDDLDGELNLSDDGDDQRDELRHQKACMRKLEPLKKVRKFR